MHGVQFDTRHAPLVQHDIINLHSMLLVYQRSVEMCSILIDRSLLKPIVTEPMKAILYYDASL